MLKLNFAVFDVLFMKINPSRINLKKKPFDIVLCAFSNTLSCIYVWLTYVSSDKQSFYFPLFFLFVCVLYFEQFFFNLRVLHFPFMKSIHEEIMSAIFIIRILYDLKLFIFCNLFWCKRNNFKFNVSQKHRRTMHVFTKTNYQYESTQHFSWY